MNNMHATQAKQASTALIVMIVVIVAYYFLMLIFSESEYREVISEKFGDN